MPTASINLYIALTDIIKAHPHSIRAAVAREALDYHDIPAFYYDLIQHGCISGMVSSLIYYTDTHAFFDKHYSEIEGIRLQLESELPFTLDIKSDLKNYLAWLAFEEVAINIGQDFGLDI